MVLVGNFPPEYAEEGSLFAISPCGHLAAFAKGVSLVILATSRPYSPLRLCDTPAEQGTISSIAWLALADGTCCLAYGTTEGSLGLLDRESIFHVVTLHHAPVLAMKYRTQLWSVIPSSYANVPEELLVLHDDGFLVLICGQSIVKTLKDCAPELWKDVPGGGITAPMSPESPRGPAEVALEIYKVILSNETGDRQTFGDAAPCGPLLGSALDVFSQDIARHVLAVGSNPTVACYEFRPKSADFSASSTLKAVTKTVAKAGVAVLKGSIKSVGWFFGAETEETPPPEPKEKVRRKEAMYTLSDPERSAATISVDCLGRTAAVTDQLGRVLVIDVPLFCIVNVLKGYRDCQVGWLYCPSNGTQVDPSSMASFMVLYLPRRGVLEIWKMGPHMTRARAVKVGYGCRLIQAAKQFAAPVRDGPLASCYLLLSNGSLHFVDPNLSLSLKQKGDMAQSYGRPAQDDEVANEAECLRILEETGDEPRDILRAVLQLDGTPEMMRKLTQLAVEKLQGNVAAASAPASPRPESPLRHMSENDTRTEYERCFTGQQALRDPWPMLQYLTQRYALLQAYCLLLPYSGGNATSSTRFQADWVALVGPKPTHGANILTEALAAESGCIAPHGLDFATFLGMFEFHGNSIVPIVDYAAGSAKAQQLAAFLFGVLAGGGSSGLDSMSSMRITILRAVLHHLNLPDTALCILLVLFVLHCPTNRLFNVDPADLLQVLAPMLANASPPALRHQPPSPSWLPEAVGDPSNLFSIILRLQYRSHAIVNVLFTTHLLTRCVNNMGRTGDAFMARLSSINTLLWDLLKLRTVADRQLSLRQVMEGTSFQRILAEEHLQRQHYYLSELGPKLSEVSEPSPDIHSLITDIWGSSTHGLQLFHFHCTILCARRYLEEVQHSSRAGWLHDAVVTHLRHVLAHGQSVPQTARWFGGSQPLIGWCVALTCIYQVMTLWYAPIGAVLASAVRDAVLVSEGLALKAVQLPGAVLQAHADAVQAVVNMALEMMGRLSGVSHQVVRDAHHLARQHVNGCSWRDHELSDCTFQSSLQHLVARFPEDTPLSHHRDAFVSQERVLQFLRSALAIDEPVPLQLTSYITNFMLFYFTPEFNSSEDTFEECLCQIPSDRNWSVPDNYFAEPGLAPIAALVDRCAVAKYAHIRSLFLALFPDGTVDALLLLMVQVASTRTEAPELDDLVAQVAAEYQPQLCQVLFQGSRAWLAAVRDYIGQSSASGKVPPNLRATFPSELLQDPVPYSVEGENGDEYNGDRLMQLLRLTKRAAQRTMNAIEEPTFTSKDQKPPEHRQCKEIIRYCVDSQKCLKE